jgi:hypothetical protein
MATITWSVSDLESNVSDGVVTAVHYRLDAVDGEETIGTYGSIGLNRTEDSPTLIEFSALTEADVLNWVKSSFDSSEDVTDEEGNTTTTTKDFTNVEAELVAQLELKKVPVTTKGMPWVTETPTE